MQTSAHNASESPRSSARTRSSNDNSSIDFSLPEQLTLDGSGILSLRSQLSFDGVAVGDFAEPRDSILHRILNFRFGETYLLQADTFPTPIGRLLPLLWMFIALVSTVDTYLSVKFPIFLNALEENPIGRFLLQADSGDPALLVSAKFFSGMLVMSVLILSHRWYSQLCRVLSITLSLFQVWLLGYLLFA